MAVAIVAAIVVSGCAHQPAGPRQGSVESCIQFGIRAIQRHITVSSVPPACQGLTKAQINFAVGSALHASAVGAHGKVALRKRVAKLSHFLAPLVSAVPRQRRTAPAAAPPARQPSQGALGWTALGCWLVTVGLGARMLGRWLARGGRSRARPGHAQPRHARAKARDAHAGEARAGTGDARAGDAAAGAGDARAGDARAGDARALPVRAGRGRLPSPLLVAHFGLAVTGLVAWAVYLVTGVAGVAWAGFSLLLPVAGLGMAVFLTLPERPEPGDTSPGRTASASPARARRPPALTVAAHGVFAAATILFALLAAIGQG
jgi:hypothetical protein